MTFNGYFALNSVSAPIRLASETAIFESICVKAIVNIAPYYQQGEYSAGTLISGDTGLCRYVRGYSRKEASNDSGVRVNARGAVACILA